MKKQIYTQIFLLAIGLFIINIIALIITYQTTYFELVYKIASVISILFALGRIYKLRKIHLIYIARHTARK